MLTPAITDYELLKPIGAGSYGEVWLVRNVLGTLRALKLVRAGAFKDRKPFEREFSGIKTYAAVAKNHPNLVQILHAGVNEADGFFYYVMELADSVNTNANAANYAPRTLSEDLRERKNLAPAEVISLAKALASGLQHLHENGLVHRDIKPPNIVYVENIPKLADIGLVALVGESRSFVGTEGYVPPEGPGTAAADIYALGKVLYQALSGNDCGAFPKMDYALAAGPDSRLLLEVNELILKACEQNPAQRHASAREVLEDLDTIEHGKSLTARRRALAFRKGALRTSVAIAALAAVGFVTTTALHSRREAYFLKAQKARLSTEVSAKSDGLEAIRKTALANRTPELFAEAAGLLAKPDLETLPNSLAFPAAPTAYGWDLTKERLAIGLANGAITIFEKGVARNLPANPENLPVDLLCFQPGGDFLAVRYKNISCWVWDLRATNVVKKTRWITGNLKPDRAFAFSKNGKFAASGVLEKLIRIFPLPSWDQGPGLETAARPTWLAFSVDSSTLAAIEGRKIELWTAPAFTEKRAFDLPIDAFTMEWHPSRNLAAIGGKDGQVCLFDAESGGVKILGSHPSIVLGAAFDPAGQYIVTASRDRSSRLWSAFSGEELLRQNGAFWLGFAGSERILQLNEGESFQTARFTDSPVFAIAPKIASTNAFTTKRPGVFRAAISPNREWIAWSDWESRAVTLENQKSRQSLSLPFGLSDLTFSPDSRFLAASCSTNLVVFDLANQKETYRLPKNTPIDQPDPTAFSANAELMATPAQAGYIALYSTGHGRLLQKLPTPPDRRIVALSFTDKIELIIHTPDASRVWNLPALNTNLAALGLKVSQ